MFIDIRKQNVIFSLFTKELLNEKLVRKLFMSFNLLNQEVYSKVTYFVWTNSAQKPKEPIVYKMITSIDKVPLPLEGGGLQVSLNAEENKLRPLFASYFGGFGVGINKIEFSFPYNDIVNNLVGIGNLLEPVFTEGANQLDLLTGYVGLNFSGAASGFVMSDYELDLHVPFDWSTEKNSNKYLRGVYWLNYIKEDLWKKVEKNLEGEDCEVIKVGKGYVLKLSKDLDSFTDEKRRHFESLMAEILPKGIPPYDDEDIPAMLEKMKQSGK